MPLQNRVDPFSQIKAVPSRGMFMGNRGVLHDTDRRIHRAFVGKRWIICRTRFKGRKRQLMANGAYTELFFLDEATALAAGHRPCAECRRARYREFISRYAAAHPEVCQEGKPSAGRVDAHLHRHRHLSAGETARYSTKIAELPHGVLFVDPQEPERPLMQWRGRTLAWDFRGYTVVDELPAIQRVQVLTPRPVVAVIAAGYEPVVHPSALCDEGLTSR